MGNTFKTGNYVNGIFQDASNNIGIGGSPSGSYKFDVTGTGRFTSTLLANGISSIGQEQAFTFQRTTGTASDLYSINADSGSAYLYNNTTSKALMTWLEGGNVGIGTGSPQRLLDVRGPVNLSNTTPTIGSTSGAYADVHLRTFSGYPTAQAKIVVVDYFMDFYATYTDGFRFFNWDSAGTTPVERMRITSGGNVGIGNSDPQIKLHVIAGSGTGTTTAFCLERGGGYGATFFKQYYNNGSDWGLIVQSSTNADGVKLVQGATSWTSNSDERLKDIIEPISNATNKINTLRAVVGKYKTDDEDKRRLFLIAQDVNNVFPEVVDIDGTDDAYMGIRYSELVPVLIKAIQELNAKVSALENKS